MLLVVVCFLGQPLSCKLKDLAICYEVSVVWRSVVCNGCILYRQLTGRCWGKTFNAIINPVSRLFARKMWAMQCKANIFKLGVKWRGRGRKMCVFQSKTGRVSETVRDRANIAIYTIFESYGRQQLCNGTSYGQKFCMQTRAVRCTWPEHGLGEMS